MELRATLNLAHEILDRAQIPHALIGGMALGAHGVNRATRDVDFLVDEEHLFQQGPTIEAIRKKCGK